MQSQHTQTIEVVPGWLRLNVGKALPILRPHCDTPAALGAVFLLKAASQLACSEPDIHADILLESFGLFTRRAPRIQTELKMRRWRPWEESNLQPAD